MLHSESAEGAEMLEFKLSQLDGTTHEEVGSMIRYFSLLAVHSDPQNNLYRIPLFSDVTDELKSWFEKLQEPFYPSKEVFHRGHNQYTAIYSRYGLCPNTVFISALLTADMMPCVSILSLQAQRVSVRPQQRKVFHACHEVQDSGVSVEKKKIF